MIHGAKVEQIELFFKALYKEVEFLATDPRVSTALIDLNEGFQAYRKDSDPEEEATLEAFYTEQFFPKLAENLSTRASKYSTYRPQSATARYLQYYYLVQKQKDFLNEKKKQDPEGVAYIKAHAKYDTFFQNLVNLQAYGHLFLINPSGDIVYSTSKHTDFATNLLNGPYAQSGLAEVVQLVLADRDPGVIKVVDL